MEFIYIGNPAGKDARSDTRMFGYSFEYGVPVEVKEEWVAKKLQGNSHFRVKRALTVAPGAIDIPAGDDDGAGEDAPKRRGRPPKVID